MNTGTARKILRCSYSSIQNYVKDGRLALSGRTEKGRYELDDASVYALAARRRYVPPAGRMVVVFGADGEMMEFSPSEQDLAEVMRILARSII